MKVGDPRVGLEFVSVSHAFDDKAAVSNVSLTAKPGAITCLLGPSGCGKTTLLRLAAGLLDVQQGEILLDGNLLASAAHSPPPEKRNVGLVFQEGALFPHLTVEENIVFGVAKDPGKTAKAARLLDQLGLTGFGDRYPHTLSGGQQQRVALARALAPQPRVLLLDEPFANLDVLRRRALRQETRRELIRSEAIAILVTHDPEEALEVADTIVGMHQGAVMQIGGPAEIYAAPATASVGAMFGGGQIAPAEKRDGGLDLGFGVWPTACVAGPIPETAQMEMLVRPSALSVEKAEVGACRIEDVRPAGEFQRLLIVSENQRRLWADAPNDASFAVGETVAVSARAASLFAFPAAGIAK